MAKIIISFGFMILISSTIGVLGDVNDNEIEEIHMVSGVRIYQMERQCAMVGGLCAHTTDCILKTSTDGLCPENQSRGIECCYELKIDKTKSLPCKQHGGECMNWCHPRIARNSSDCGDNQTCCILVR